MNESKGEEKYSSNMKGRKGLHAYCVGLHMPAPHLALNIQNDQCKEENIMAHSSH